MICGASAMFAYCTAATICLERTKLQPWLIAGLLWLLWLAVALGLYWLALR